MRKFKLCAGYDLEPWPVTCPSLNKLALALLGTEEVFGTFSQKSPLYSPGYQNLAVCAGFVLIELFVRKKKVREFTKQNMPFNTRMKFTCKYTPFLKKLVSFLYCWIVFRTLLKKWCPDVYSVFSLPKLILEDLIFLLWGIDYTYIFSLQTLPKLQV